MSESKRTNNETRENKPTCLVIMPFSDPDGYSPGHFRKIYEQILSPAIVAAGYTPHRIDENAESTMIHGKLLDQLVNAPMVLCDLSSKNPNVLYELGIRHAFDKPVVLVQEKGQDRIFDIAGLTTTEYRKERLYDEVIADQQTIAEAIRQTTSAEKYSIMSLIQLTPATINKDKQISGEDRTKILLTDIYQKLSRIEERSSSIQTPTSHAEGDPGKLDTEKRLRNLMSMVRIAMNSPEKSLSSAARYNLHALMRSLDDAIVDCQRVINPNRRLIMDAKQLLAKLTLFLSEQNETVNV